MHALVGYLRDRLVSGGALVASDSESALGTATGLAGSVPPGARAPVVAALAAISPVVVLVATEEEAEALAGDLALFGREDAAILPALEERGDTPESLSERLWLVRRIVLGQATLVIADLRAALEPLPAPERFAQLSLALNVGATHELGALVERFLAAGLARRARVEAPGEFAVRGAILDVFPYAQENPLRIEIDDDRIASLRRFAVDTQISIERLETADLLLVPADELGQPGGAGTHLLAIIAAERTRWRQIRLEPQELEARATRLVTSAANPLPWRAALAETQAAPVPRFDISQLPAAHDAPGQIDLGLATVQRYQGHLEGIRTRVAEEMAQGERIVIFCRNEAERVRMGELLAGAGGVLPSGVELDTGALSEGFRVPALATTVLSGDALVGRHQVLRRRRRRFAATPAIESLASLSDGDLVVHMSHGIARFRGLERLAKHGRVIEHLVLEFEGGTRLLVNVANADLIHRYVGAGDEVPTLAKLGGTRWQTRRERVAEAVLAMAGDLLRTQALRAEERGIKRRAASHYVAEFEAAFPYEPTRDQEEAMREIHADMARPQPMDRLLCGDVGYGKTELAMRAAFMAVDAGFQVAVLVPTTVLAAQHRRTFRERMAQFPVTIAELSRFESPAAQARVVAGLAAGTVDIVIGTHRLLSRDVRFANLGLAIIDEEQRFGVKHKEHLKRLRTEIDVLTLTATPIPRTLHLALLGIRDISTLRTPPRERSAVATRVVETSDGILREAISEELARDGQVFVIHNRIYDLEALAGRIMRLVPEARVGIGHGQMPEDLLEKTMAMFVDGELDVLVATTIVENGLDIPNANTILIDQADNYGLAELHQLRGRVGRYNRRAFCYLMIDPRRAPTPIGLRRIRALEEHAELGAGFDIAMRDLEIRGAGNIVGAEQSGHIAAVGYELYCRLLRAAADGLRHLDSSALPPEIAVDLGLAGEIPEHYVPDADERLVLYMRVATVGGAAHGAVLRSELVDRFGPVPEEVEVLFLVARCKPVLGALGVTVVAADFEGGRHRLVLKTGAGRAPAVARALASPVEFVRYVDDDTVMIDLRPPPRSVGEALARLSRLLVERPESASSPAPAGADRAPRLQEGV